MWSSVKVPRRRPFGSPILHPQRTKPLYCRSQLIDLGLGGQLQIFDPADAQVNLRLFSAVSIACSSRPYAEGAPSTIPARRLAARGPNFHVGWAPRAPPGVMPRGAPGWPRGPFALKYPRNENRKSSFLIGPLL